MRFWKRRKEEEEALERAHTGEIEQAQQLRDEASQEMLELQIQKYEVSSLVRKLARRRELNHFGEDISVSFTRREGSV